MTRIALPPCITSLFIEVCKQTLWSLVPTWLQSPSTGCTMYFSHWCIASFGRVLRRGSWSWRSTGSRTMHFDYWASRQAPQTSVLATLLSFGMWIMPRTRDLGVFCRPSYSSFGHLDHRIHNSYEDQPGINLLQVWIVAKSPRQVKIERKMVSWVVMAGQTVEMLMPLSAQSIPIVKSHTLSSRSVRQYHDPSIGIIA